MSDLELSEKERERIVIELYKKKVPAKEIARQLKMSLRDVYKIIHREFGDKERELTTEHRAVTLFLKGKSPVYVAIKLRISLDESSQYYAKYKDTLYLGKFGQNYKYIRDYMKELAQICDATRHAGMKIKDIIDGYYLEKDLAEMEERHLYLVNSTQEFEIRKNLLESSVQQLEERIISLQKDIEVLEHRQYVANDFLTYQKPSNYIYGQGAYWNNDPNQLYPGYNQNYYRYW